jgi:hypothetical protein
MWKEMPVHEITGWVAAMGIIVSPASFRSIGNKSRCSFLSLAIGFVDNDKLDGAALRL